MRSRAPFEGASSAVVPTCAEAGHNTAFLAGELRRRTGSGSPSTSTSRFACWYVRPTSWKHRYPRRLHGPAGSSALGVPIEQGWRCPRHRRAAHKSNVVFRSPK